MARCILRTMIGYIARGDHASSPSSEAAPAEVLGMARWVSAMRQLGATRLHGVIDRHGRHRGLVAPEGGSVLVHAVGPGGIKGALLVDTPAELCRLWEAAGGKLQPVGTTDAYPEGEHVVGKLNGVLVEGFMEKRDGYFGVRVVDLDEDDQIRGESWHPAEDFRALRPFASAGIGRPISTLQRIWEEQPKIKRCTVCNKGDAYRWLSGMLECDACGAIGDAFLGLMQPRNDS